MNSKKSVPNRPDLERWKDGRSDQWLSDQFTKRGKKISRQVFGMYNRGERTPKASALQMIREILSPDEVVKRTGVIT